MRAQTRGPGLHAHPAQHLVEQQRDEEHALGVSQVRDGEDRDARLSLRRVQQAGDVQRLALQPRLEARRGQQVVQRHRQRKPLLGRVERLQVEHADARRPAAIARLDQRPQVEVPPLLPGVAQDRGEQDVLPALDRVRLDAEQSQQRGRGGVDALAQQLRVLDDGRSRRGERLENRDRQARRAARSVHGEVRRLAQPPDAARVLPPGGEPVLPELRLLAGVLLGRDSLGPRVVLVDPGEESPPADRSGKVSSRLEMSPLGSMTSAGTPSMAASSSSARQRPVFPLPVMPKHTAWVTRSLES